MFRNRKFVLLAIWLLSLLTLKPVSASTSPSLPRMTAWQIMGSTELPGTILTYDNGARTVVSDVNGNYSIIVPDGWTGAVTPSHPGYVFSPSTRFYNTPINADMSGQDYGAMQLTSTPTPPFTPTLTQTPTSTPTLTSTMTGTPTFTSTRTATVSTLTFVSVGTYDGWLLESSENSGLGGALSSTSGTIVLGDSATKQQYRAILSFNTSPLPNGAIIRSVILKLAQSGSATGGNPFKVLGTLWADIRQGAFGSTTALAPDDFDAAASATKVGAVGSAPTNGWYSAPLNAAGRGKINPAGVTQLRLYFSLDDNNNSVADTIKFFSGNAASNKPQLVIVYSAP